MAQAMLVGFDQEPVREKKACRSCGASVFFARTAKGATAILDWESDEEKGNMRLDAQGVARYVGPIGEGPRYHSHFWTCPDAERWRR